MTKEKHFNDIKVDIVDDNETYAKFIAEPFERGYGQTIGNSLRRILLTSIPGAAITSVKIDGVQHEFSNIKGVVEDVSQIIQNLKNVRFALNDFGPEVISFDIEGPCQFLAKDINAHGVHFPEYMIKEKNKINWVILKNIKLKKNWIITTAAHSLKSIKKAEFFDIDAALLSPVFSSKSHPNRKNLGINKFAKIVKKTKLPIYALGGINIKNIKSLIETDIIGYAFQRGI